MYVCLCNALKDRQMKAAAAAPDCAGVADVFKACGAKPRCGKCLHMVADMIEDVRAEASRIAPVAAE